MKFKDENLGFIEGWVSVVLNNILFALKIWVGIISGSVAMVADAWHTLSDTLTSIVVIFGFWIAKKPADEKHPFGHGRAEVIAAIVISILLATVGVHFLSESIHRLRNFKSVTFGIAGIIIFLCSVFLKEGLALFSMWAGRKIDSKSLIADGWHHRSDAIASGLIVVGGILGKYFWWIDGVLGILVSLLILKAAYDIFKDTSNILMGEEADALLINKIKQIVNNLSGDTFDLHHVHIHRYGPHKEITFHLRFPGKTKLKYADDMVFKIKSELREKLNVEVTIEVDAIER